MLKDSGASAAAVGRVAWRFKHSPDMASSYVRTVSPDTISSADTADEEVL
jgi:hypothetical protein